MSPILMQLLPIAGMFALLYFLMIVPDKKRRKQYDNMLNDLRVNDEVMTKGGIIGKIISIDEDSIVLESGPNRVRIKLSKNGIGQLLNKKEDEISENKTKETKEIPMAKEIKEEK